MKVKETEFVKNILTEYYSKASFEIRNIEQREFGVGYKKKIDARHLSFPNLQEFRRYLVSNIPLFVSHSSSYYEFPGATPIGKKVRRGADLIFDLDIHSEGKYSAYSNWEKIKEETARLVNDFLVSDFGIQKKNILVVFSGNRGYHAHVRGTSFEKLGSDERKEIVEYISGMGLDYLEFFPPQRSGKREKLIGPRPDESGYRGRFSRAAISLLENNPSKISRIFSDENRRKLFIDGIRKGNWSRSSLGFRDLLMRLKVVADSLPVKSVETDFPVTTDLSKLIRVPNSIHGSTGFVAAVVEDLGKFDPGKNVLLETEKEVKIRFTEDVPELLLRGETTGPFKKSDEKRMDGALALFYILKESAELLLL